MLVKLTNINIVSFLVLLFPAALVSGPLIPEIIIFFLFLTILYTLFKTKDFSYFNNKIFKIFLIFLLYLISSSTLSFFNYDNFHSFKNSVFYFRYGVVVYAIIYTLDNNPKLIKFFYIIYSICFFILFLDELKQLITGINFFNMPILAGRASSFFGDELVLGSFLIKVLPIFLALCFFLKKNYLIILFFIFLYGIAIFFSGSRSSFVSYILFIFFISFVFIKSKTYLLLLASLFLLIAVGIGNTNAGKRIYNHTIVQIFKKSKTPVVFSVRHQAHYETAFNIFKNHLFFGSGPNQFRYLCNKNKFAPTYTLGFKYLYAPIHPKIEIFRTGLNETKTPVELSLLLKDYISGPITKKDITHSISKLNNKSTDKVVFKEENISLYITSEDSDIFKSYILSKNDTFYLSEKYELNSKLVEFGNNKFPYEFENGCNTHPHSFHLQLLSETGIFGYSFFLFFLWVLLKNMFKNYMNKKNIKFYNEQYVLIAGILINFFPLIPSGNFFNNWLSFLLFLPIGFLIYFKKLEKKY
jgi:O-antigen ligase